MITDEMKRKALDAYIRSDGGSFDENLSDALEAVAADIRSAVLEEAEEMVLPYTQPSPVRNYGPQGTTKIEAATMEMAQFILQDLQALKTKVTP